MDALTDQQLLSEYAAVRSETAFGELVRRHIDLVYSAARRMVRDEHLAEDVTQGVFAALSQQAGQLTDRPVLSGWLHRTAQNLAANVIRSEVRRRTREQAAMAMNEMLSTASEADWKQIASHLDAAMGELSEPDRDALLLRYFECQSARQIAERLGTSEEAAQKRVSRAMERLREMLVKRGVTTGAGASASGLAMLISAQAVQAAPSGLALLIATSASVGATAAATTALAVSTTAKTFAMTTLQKTLVTATLAATLGVGGYEAWQAARLRAQVKRFQQQPQASPGSAQEATLASLRARIGQLEARNSELVNSLAQANADKNRLELEREQARHSAALFKDLAGQDMTSNQKATNAYPSPRHVMAGWGRIGRLAVELNKDQSKLSPEEKAANEVLRMKAVEEIPNLVKAATQFEKGKLSEAGSSDEDASDMATCLLYGALDLDEQQFGQVYALMQKYQRQAKQQMGENPKQDTGGLFKQLTEQVTGELQYILTSEQARIFAGVITNVHLEPGKMDFNFKF